MISGLIVYNGYDAKCNRFFINKCLELLNDETFSFILIMLYDTTLKYQRNPPIKLSESLKALKLLGFGGVGRPEFAV